MVGNKMKKYKIRPNFNTELGNQIKSAMKDLSLSMGEPENSNPNRIVKMERRARNPAISYNVKPALDGRSNVFRPPMHDYSEIARAIDTESLLARSVQKHRELILKEGFEFIGKNKETVKYIKKRLMEFEWVTDVTTEAWVRELATNVVSYHTGFIVLRRDITKSTGARIKRHGKILEPIAGIFPMDSVSVLVEQNGAGRPIFWRQDIQGITKDHDADDVIDITMDKKTGFVFGTPYCVPVLDDIRALRRLEELAELVTHKWLFPLFQYKVGDEKNPPSVIELPDGTTIDEVDMVRAQLQEMPTEGGLVTPYRHTIELIGAEGQVLDLSFYLEHFKARVMSGLRLSGIDVGQGDTANRGTATTMSKNMVDAVKDYQCTIADTLTTKLLDVLILEGGFDLTEENRVWFTFPTPDREELRAHQNHGLTLFQSNAITIEEFRRDYLNLEPLTDEELQKSTHYGLFERPDTELQAKVSLAKGAAKPASSKSKSKGSAPKKKAASIGRPSNQFGKMPTRPAVPQNDAEYTSELKKLWNDMRVSWQPNYKMGLDKGEYFVNQFLNGVDRVAKKYLSSQIDRGFINGKFDLNKTDLSLESQVYDIFILKTAKNDLQKICRKLIILLKDKKNNTADIAGVFGSYETEISFIGRRHMQAAYRFGYAQACKKSGIDKVFVGSEEKRAQIDLSSVSIKDMGVDSCPGYYVATKDLEPDETTSDV